MVLPLSGACARHPSSGSASGGIWSNPCMTLIGPSGTTCAAPAPNIVPRHCWRRSADNGHSCRAQQRTGEAEKPEHRHENLEPLRAIGLEIEVLVVEKALAGSEQAPASRVDAVEP